MKGRRLRRATVHDKLMALMGTAREWSESGEVFEEIVGERLVAIIDDMIRHTDAPPDEIIRVAKAEARDMKKAVDALFAEVGMRL